MVAALTGVALAAGAGVAISASTVLCRTLNDRGAHPTALVSLRFVGATIVAAVLLATSGGGLGDLGSWDAAAAVGAASLALVVFPIYVSQIGISLASPLTVRAVLAAAPALIFGLELVDRRLFPSLYSLAAAALYAVVAISAAIARARAIGSRAGDQSRSS
jgi:hypothetical protein